MTKSATSLVSDARQLLSSGSDYDAFVTRLSMKDRANTAKHLTAIEATPDGRAHAATWKKLIVAMASLTTSDLRTLSGHAVMFFIVDGQYRMQILALHDALDGKISVYCGDIIADAVGAKLIKPDVPTVFKIGTTDEKMTIERLDGTSRDLLPFCKNLIGWNRQAVRISLPVDASPTQVSTALDLCAITAAKLVKKA